VKTLFTDRARRRQFETSEQLSEFYNTVEQQVRERTFELQVTNTQLTEEITERKQAEDALHNSEALHRLLANNMRDQVWLMDLNLKPTYISPSVAKARGYTLEEIAQLPLDKQLTATSLQAAMEFFSMHMPKALADPKYFLKSSLELEFCRKNGSTYFVETAFSLIRDENGKPISLLGVGRDITERKQAAEELRESEERYRAISEYSHNAICIVDEQAKIVWGNNEMLTASGYSQEQLYAVESFVSFIAPESMEFVVSNFYKVLAGQPYEHHYSFYALRADGEKRLFEKHMMDFKDKSGKLKLIISMMDITDRKRVDEEKAKLEVQLLQSQKMEAIGTLAGGIAHDFNNILSAIIGYTEMAVEEDKSEIQKQYLQATLKGAERAKNLVKQILTFSRQDSHEKIPLDIKILLEDAVKFLRASIPTTIEINQQITDESCNIMADHTQMHQIIMNFCSNSAHAMRRTGGILKIELANIEISQGDLKKTPDLQPGPYVKLTFNDTGHGIDPDNIHKIFDPFFTTKSVNEGTGLGLSVVYGIVKSHGGVINVTSKLDEGATFNVYLPRIINKEVTLGNMSGTIIGGTERILFVDDEPELVDIGTRMLTSLGYDVTGVLSSVEALNMVSTEPQRFDLVITDMTLPKMTGIVLARKILKICPDIPIVLCSGIRESGTEEQVKSLGIKAYLTKPLSRREFSQAIRNTLDGDEKQLTVERKRK
jgi:PAS domain S-box-containing protein